MRQLQARDSLQLIRHIPHHNAAPMTPVRHIVLRVVGADEVARIEPRIEAEPFDDVCLIDAVIGSIRIQVIL